MKKNKTKIIALIFLMISIQLFFSNVISLRGNRIERMKANGNAIRVEIVDSQIKRQKGLSKRNSLCDVCGMLFRFDEKGKQGFWMKDMRFPIDIIWISDESVVYMEKNVPFADEEKVYRPNVLADSVLEVNAGMADKWRLKEGSVITLQR